MGFSSNVSFHARISFPSAQVLLSSFGAVACAERSSEAGSSCLICNSPMRCQQTPGVRGAVSAAYGEGPNSLLHYSSVFLALACSAF